MKGAEESESSSVAQEPLRRLLGFASARLARQLEFVLEVDRLKSVLRRTTLSDRSRHENSAEHSWHLALMAILLAEHAEVEIDLARTVEMLLVHDVVEVDAGDTFCYDQTGNLDKEERERRAAERLFGLLPEDQGERLRSLWDEFERRETPEARFAAALDRLQPMMLNYLTEGHSWQQHGVREHQVLERNRPIEDGSRDLWSLAERFLEDAVDSGILER
ncbi:MAG TPA: HD domain-containing protein [Thermoanaerobaculia bacterium]|nr:HD domain-containing protein [Thermoanaerobaculia bacterium]